ncbi:peptide ligase PGM1-related protein [uncultured Serinicoccus sp.]|uniref:preATP grasp domain-containing protein n=1 Tax=uncultured Serinicoccus sp. TaxID=735514 RepID=UPI00261D30E7|nr:peptide ligase PGM1-related protein [uncultured Serinicoccus sp.]
MSTLYVANTDTVAMAPDASGLTDHFLQKAATSAKRMVWMAGSDDHIVTPTPVSKGFLEYVARLKGESSPPKASAAAESPSVRPLPLHESILSERSDLAGELKVPAHSDPFERVHPYIADEVALAFAQTAETVVSFSKGEAPCRPLVTLHLNDKVTFRDFACLLDVPIAPGSTATSTSQLIDSVSKLLSLTGSVIVKMGRHSSGEGNLIASTAAIPKPQGAADFVTIVDAHDAGLEAALRRCRICVGPEAPVVVEAYYENDSCFGLHFHVADAGADLLGAAEQLNRPTVGGQLWSLNVLAGVPSKVRIWGQKLANYAHALGYRGPFSVDIIDGVSVGHVVTEVNGRHGGFSTIRALIKGIGLLEDVEKGKRVVLTHHGLQLRATFNAAVAQLTAAGLHYDPLSRQGAILMTEGHLDKGPYDIVIVANSHKYAQSLERDLLKIAERSR